VQVFEDGLLKLQLLLGRVCVVKPNNELAVECLVGEVIVQERGFGMSNVQVSLAFR
jgi:hypothetical protein